MLCHFVVKQARACIASYYHMLASTTCILRAEHCSTETCGMCRVLFMYVEALCHGYVQVRSGQLVVVAAQFVWSNMVFMWRAVGLMVRIHPSHG